MNMSISVSKSGLERKIGKKTIMRDRIQQSFWGYRLNSDFFGNM